MITDIYYLGSKLPSIEKIKITIFIKNNLRFKRPKGYSPFYEVWVNTRGALNVLCATLAPKVRDNPRITTFYEGGYLSFLGNFHFMNDYIIKFVLYRFEINVSGVVRNQHIVFARGLCFGVECDVFIIDEFHFFNDPGLARILIENPSPHINDDFNIVTPYFIFFGNSFSG